MSNSRKSSLLDRLGGRLASVDGGAIEIAEEMAPNVPMLLSKDLLAEHTIMSEYALICRDPIDGLYTVPSASNFYDWYGVLFIRRGVYTGAVLRFTLHIPEDFPSTTIPTLKFDLDIFHPHIDPESRELDLKRYFVDGWKPDVHHIYHVLLNLQRSFFIFEGEPTKCINKEAAQMLQNDKEAFKSIASKLIRKSRSIIYDTVSTDDPHAIRLSPWDASVHEPLRQRLIGGLTDSQISTSSLLGAFGGSNIATTESRSRIGFSWFSPATCRYMIEPQRPEELGSSMTIRCNAEPHLTSDYNHYSEEHLTENTIPKSTVIPELTRLDLSHVLDDDERSTEKNNQSEEV